MLNTIFSKKVQGQKHPRRWGIVEHQIPSIKIYTKCHKPPSIRFFYFLSKSNAQLVNQRKHKMAFRPGTAHSPIERDGVQLRQYWMTIPLYIRPTNMYNRNRIRNVHTYIYIYIYIYTELLDGNQGHQEETHRPTHRFRRLLLDLLSMGWRGCASAMGAIKLPPSCSSPKIMCQSIYIIQYMQ